MHVYINSVLQRVMAYAPVVKSKFIIRIYLESAFEVFRDSSKLAQLTDAEIRTNVNSAIIRYVSSIEAGGSFTWSKAISQIHSDVPEVVRINTDSAITYKFRNPNNLEELSGVFIERFYLEEVGDELLSEQITYDTIIFYTDTDMLNLTISN